MVKSKRTPEAIAERRRWWAENTNVPYGYCWCGCGEQTAPAVQTDNRANILVGEPRRYVLNHHGKYIGAQYEVVDCGYHSPCWLWRYSLDTRGYGQAWHQGRLVYAHRVYYEHVHTYIPEGLQLDHLCRVPRCVNPDHLEAVSQAENARRGKVATLTYKQVAEIHDLHATGKYSQREIGLMFGVNQTTISRVILKKTWR